MQNGNVNGAGPAQQTIQVNPMQAAAFALQFLARAASTRAERESYDVAEMFLQAIASGQLTIGPAAHPTALAPAAGADAPPPQ